jgi:TPP-dependent pyruvate/acetoin dehydrogenase alpha subunit
MSEQHIVSISSPIGTHLVQAAGTAMAQKLKKDKGISWAFFGDGGTSSNDFHSGLNFAGVAKAPVVFVCTNNQWAISVPLSKQTASETIAIKAEAYGMPGVVVDGNDLLAVRKATLEAVERARKGGGPTLIEAQTFRMGGHSTSDDPTRYVPKELVAEWERKDPLARFERFLEKRKLWSAKTREQYYSEAMAEIDAAAKEAAATPRPALETIFSDVYATLPAHLRRQGQQAFEVAARQGEAEAGDGKFPL